MLLELPHIMFLLEDGLLNAVSLNVLRDTLGVFGDSTVVVEVGLLEDIATEFTLDEDIVERFTLSIISLRESLLNRQERFSLREIDPEALLHTRRSCIIFLVLIFTDRAKTDNTDIETRILAVEEPYLLYEETLNLLSFDGRGIIDLVFLIFVDGICTHLFHYGLKSHAVLELIRLHRRVCLKITRVYAIDKDLNERAAIINGRAIDREIETFILLFAEVNHTPDGLRPEYIGLADESMIKVFLIFNMLFDDNAIDRASILIVGLSERRRAQSKGEKENQLFHTVIDDALREKDLLNCKSNAIEVTVATIRSDSNDLLDKDLTITRDTLDESKLLGIEF